MFKERLKITCKYLLNEVILPFVAFVVIVTAIVFIGIKIPKLFVILAWAVAIVIGLILLLGILCFIYWLFIEPFKKKVADD